MRVVGVRTVSEAGPQAYRWCAVRGGSAGPAERGRRPDPEENQGMRPQNGLSMRRGYSGIMVVRRPVNHPN